VGPEFVIVHLATRPCHVVVRGEIDICTAPALHEALCAAAEAAVRRPAAMLTVDLSAVSFIDARGLSALIVAEAYACVRGVRMLLTGRSASLTRLLQVTGLRLNDLDAQSP
jgi:anti-sigma B factor antagonist